MKVIWGREVAEHLKGFFYSLVTRRETRAFWTFQSPAVSRWLCHFPFVVSFSATGGLTLLLLVIELHT